MTTGIDKFQAPSSDNHLDFQICLFCYKNLPLSRSAGGGGHKSLDKAVEVEKFFKLLTRYLLATPEDHSREIDKFGAVLRGDRGRFDSCEDCHKVVLGFCEAYRQMKVAQLEVDVKLSALTTLMTNADLERRGADNEEDETPTLVEKMRSNLLRRCSRRLGHLFPRPLLRTCEASSETDPVSETGELAKYKCLHCPKRFGGSFSLKRHYQTVHEDEMPVFRATSETQDSRAVPTEDPDHAEVAAETGVTSAEDEESSSHTKVQVGTKSVRCSYCRLSYSSRGTATQHELQCHRSKVFAYMKEPGVSEEQFTKLLNDVPNHFIARTKCAICDYQGNRAGLQRHVMLSHTQRFWDELKSQQQRLLGISGPPESPVDNKDQDPHNRDPNKKDSSLKKRSRGKPKKTFSCMYCDQSFNDASKKRTHALQMHPELELATYKRMTTSLEDFRVGVRNVFQALVTGDSGGPSWCFVCKKKFMARIDGELHILKTHSNHFSAGIKAYQRHLAQISSWLPTEPVESRVATSAPFIMVEGLPLQIGPNQKVVDSVNGDDRMEVEDSLPTVIFVPKPESDVDEGGSINTQEEEGLSFLGI